MKPHLFVLDDEPEVLSAIKRDLSAHYGETYRIIGANSGAEALDVVRELKKRDDLIALFLADQRMPGMDGTAFLAEARKLYPEARKVLLTAYADTEAAIACINDIGLDYYLMKPWDPPEQHLYPVLDDLLGDWLATVPVPYDGIRVAGTLLSSASHSTKEFLALNGVPYRWLDIDEDEQARELVKTIDKDLLRLPIVFFPDGDALIEPDRQMLAEKIGLRTKATRPFYDLIIVGAGPAGLAAAVAGASEGMRVAVIEKEAIGGQAGNSYRIENYLGFPRGISGADLARRAATQARRLGAEILLAQAATQVCIGDPYRFVTLSDGTELSCHALLIASGVSHRQLKVPGIEALNGAGVYYGAAVTEAAYYRDQHVFVVGGANSAGQGAMFLSRYARQVTLLVRGSSLQKGMSQYLVSQVAATNNIEVQLRTTVVEVKGEGKLEAIVTKQLDADETRTVPAAALFIFIGAVPRSDLVAGLVERNNAGFIITGQDLMRNGRRPENWPLRRDPFLLESSVPGIFAAGDVRQGSPFRVASAVGQGGMAVSLVHQYLRSV